MRRLASVAVLALVAACAAAIVLGITLDDDTGDTIGNGSAHWDLLEVGTRSVGDRAEFLLRFDRPVTLSAPGEPLDDDDLRGFVALDLDNDPDTPAGNPLAALLPGLCPGPAELGIELLIEVFERGANGTFALRRPSLATAALVRPSVSGSTLTLSLPLAEIGDLAPGIGLAVGSESVIDCLPNEP